MIFPGKGLSGAHWMEESERFVASCDFAEDETWPDRSCGLAKAQSFAFAESRGEEKDVHVVLCKLTALLIKNRGLCRRCSSTLPFLQVHIKYV